MKFRKRVKLKYQNTFGRLTTIIRVTDLSGCKIANLVIRDNYTIFNGEMFVI